MQVQRVLSTKKGEVCIKITERTKDGIETFRKKVEENIENRAKMEIQTKLETVVIRDIDEQVTEDDLRAGIEEHVDINSPYKLNITERRPGAIYTNAYLLIPASAAEKLLQRRRIRAGWTYCRIEKKITPTRCFNCCRYGRRAKECKSEKKANACLKCGEEGHKAATCLNEEKCCECNISGHRADSFKCPVYRKLVELIRRENKR